MTLIIRMDMDVEKTLQAGAALSRSSHFINP